MTADREAAIRERLGQYAHPADVEWLLAELAAAREQNEKLREALRVSVLVILAAKSLYEETQAFVPDDSGESGMSAAWLELDAALVRWNDRFDSEELERAALSEGEE